MKNASVQIESWDQPHRVGQIPEELSLGDRIVFSIEGSQDVGVITKLEDQETNQPDAEQRSWVRQATADDSRRLRENNANIRDEIKYCQEQIRHLNLEMKLISGHISLDGRRIIYGFTSEGRVDFRELLRDLTRHTKKSVRLQQIGIRDEARVCGDLGACGRELCCRKFLKQLVSVTSQYAKVQQIEHRGCDRLSGSCGRLKCCLAFEMKTYVENSAAMPEVGTQAKTPKGAGRVTSRNLVNQTYRVLLDDGTTYTAQPNTKS
jgi:cell fate regulator YaaT (PSP1 superfamily)